jgi:hypothetical protein
MKRHAYFICDPTEGVFPPISFIEAELKEKFEELSKTTKLFPFDFTNMMEKVRELANAPIFEKQKCEILQYLVSPIYEDDDWQGSLTFDLKKLIDSAQSDFLKTDEGKNYERMLARLREQFEREIMNKEHKVGPSPSKLVTLSPEKREQLLKEIMEKSDLREVNMQRNAYWICDPTEEKFPSIEEIKQELDSILLYWLEPQNFAELVKTEFTPAVLQAEHVKWMSRNKVSEESVNKLMELITSLSNASIPEKYKCKILEELVDPVFEEGDFGEALTFDLKGAISAAIEDIEWQKSEQMEPVKEPEKEPVKEPEKVKRLVPSLIPKEEVSRLVSEKEPPKIVPEGKTPSIAPWTEKGIKSEKDLLKFIERKLLGKPEEEEAIDLSKIKVRLPLGTSPSYVMESKTLSPEKVKELAELLEEEGGKGTVKSTLQKDAKYFNIFKHYDKNGGVWELDKDANKIKRKKIEQAVKSGGFWEYNVGETLHYANDTEIIPVTIVERLAGLKYKVQPKNGSPFEVEEKELFVA